MAQQNIDFGAFPDDPSADAIRTAFTKVQNNFNQLFGANANSAVLSINRTPGAGVTVNFPTGNVVISANIACLNLSTTSLRMGIGSDNTRSNVTVTSSSQTLNIDINPNLVQSNYFAAVSNGLSSFNGILTANSNSQPNITSVGNLTGLRVIGNASFTGSNVSISNIANLHIPGGSAGYVLATTGAGNLFWSSISTGNGTPGAPLTSVQFNNSGGFGGSANFTFDSANNVLTLNGNLIANNIAANSITTPINTDDLIVKGQIFVDWLDGNGQPFPGAGIVASTANIYNIGSLTNKFANAYFNANVYAGNASLGNLVIANYFSGDGSLLSNLSLSNSSVGVANFANYAGNVTVSSQPNITSLGNLTGLTVNGTANVTNFNTTGNVVIGGNLVVQGNATYYNITSFNVEDPIISVGGGVNGAPLTNDDGKDRGIELKYYTTTPVSAFMGWDTGNGEFAFGSNVTISAGELVTYNSLGNARGLTWLGNIVGSFANFGNANLGNTANASYFIGNLYGTANTANIANTVSTNAQPNITSVGTLTLLAVTGNTTSGNFIGKLANGNSNISIAADSNINLNAVGVSIANITGTGINVAGTGNFTGNLSASALYGPLSNGNSNVNIATANGNIVITAVGNSVLTVSGTGANIAGTANITGTANVGNLNTYIANATYLKGDGSNITNLSITAGTSIVNGTSNVSIPASNGNINHYVNSNNIFIVTGTGANVSGTFNATGIITGNGNGLSSIAGANVTGTVANATYSVTAGTAYSVSAGNVSGAVNLANYATTANAVAGANVSGTVANATYAVTAGTANAVAGANVSGTVANATYSVTAGTANAVAGANVSGTVANATYAVTAGTAYSVSAGNISGAVNLANYATTANAVAGANVSGTVANATYATSAGSATTSGTVTTNAQPNITSTGTLTSLAVTGNITNGNVTGGNLVSANYLTGTLTTAAQPNITSVGTLSSLTVTGNITSGNANLGNLAKANFFQGDGGLLSNLTISAGSSIVNGNSNVIVTANGNVNTSVAGNANILVITGTGANVSGTFNATGNITGANITGNHYGAGNNLSNIQGANVSGAVASATSATTAATVTTNAQPNITSVGTLTSLAVTGNVSAGNVSATTFTGALSGAATSATTAGTVTTNAQPNITSVGTLTSLSVNGTVTAVAFTANTGVFTGNGNGLSSLVGANVTGTVANATYATSAGTATSATTAATVTTNAQPNITSVGTLTSLSAGNITTSQFILHSVTTGISAFGTNQATATTLTKEINIVSTVASGQGVALPTAVAGMVLYITNSSANSLLVYPGTSAQINSLGTNAALTQAAGATLQFIAPTTTQWYSVGATYS